MDELAARRRRHIYLYGAFEVALIAISVYVTRRNILKQNPIIARTIADVMLALSRTLNIADKSVVWAWSVKANRYCKYQMIAGKVVEVEAVAGDDKPPSSLKSDSYWHMGKQEWLTDVPPIIPYVNNARGLIMRAANVIEDSTFIALGGGTLYFDNSSKTLRLRHRSNFPTKKPPEKSTLPFTIQRYMEYLNISSPPPIAALDNNTKEHPYAFFEFEANKWQLRTCKDDTCPPVKPVPQLPKLPLMPLNRMAVDCRQAVIHLDKMHAVIVWLKENVHRQHIEHFQLMGYPNVERSMNFKLDYAHRTCTLYQEIRYVHFNAGERYLLDLNDPLTVYERDVTTTTTTTTASMNSIEFNQPVLVIDNAIYGMNMTIQHVLKNSILSTEPPIYHYTDEKELSVPPQIDVNNDDDDDDVDENDDDDEDKNDDDDDDAAINIDSFEFYLQRNKYLPHVETRIYSGDAVFYVGRLGNVVMDMCIPFPRITLDIFSGDKPVNTSINFPATKNLLDNADENFKVYSFRDIYTVAEPLARLEVKNL